MSGPEQPKVTDEAWNDERIRSFLDLTPYDDENPDYHVLLKAYQGMVPENFQRFVKAFVAEHRDLNAVSCSGKTFLQLIEGHGRSQAYVQILKQAEVQT